MMVLLAAKFTVYLEDPELVDPTQCSSLAFIMEGKAKKRAFHFVSRESKEVLVMSPK